MSRDELLMGIKAKARIKAILLLLLMPSGYNMPSSWQMLWNQWLHQGYLWGWWTLEFYTNNQKDLPNV